MWAVAEATRGDKLRKATCTEERREHKEIIPDHQVEFFSCKD